MENYTAVNDLSLRLDRLFADRVTHAAALSRIEQTLSSINSLLGGSNGALGNGGAAIKRRTVSPAPARKRRRGPGTYATTAAETILAFVASRGQAARAEVNAHWKEVGRAGTADNTLTTLVKAQKLKRQHVDGRRGSVYSIA